MQETASILVFCMSREAREFLDGRLAPLTVRFAGSAAELLDTAADEPAVVVLAPASESEASDLVEVVAELRSRLPDSPVLFLSDTAADVPQCDAVLDPACSDAELVQTCRLLARIAELRRSLAETVAALEQAIQHQDALAESHEQQLAQLTEAALTDGLTDVPNRRHLERRLEETFAEAERAGQALSVAVVDLDHFKAINERFGHEAGDLVLRESADALQTGLRQGDFIGRIGGDEFVVLLPFLGPDDLLGIAGRLLERIASRRIDYEGQTIMVRASAGLSTYPDDRTTRASELLRHADLAMLEAKRQGRNRICVWSSALGTPE